MKETIYTIPVRDAFSQEGDDCPLCILKDQLTDKFLTFFLGSSLMEPNIREFTNERGFCNNHATALFDLEENRLGLALMLHTRLQAIDQSMEKAMSALEGKAGRKKDVKARMAATVEAVRDLNRHCAICERISDTMAHYMDVLCWMHRHDDEFYSLFKNTHHFCVPHTAELMEGALKHLNTAEAKLIFDDVRVITARSMAEINQDVEWFTLKFDYRNKDKPWDNSKDSVIRAIRALTGGVRDSVVKRKNERKR